MNNRSDFGHFWHEPEVCRIMPKVTGTGARVHHSGCGGVGRCMFAAVALNGRIYAIGGQGIIFTAVCLLSRKRLSLPLDGRNVACMRRVAPRVTQFPVTRADGVPP